MSMQVLTNLAEIQESVYYSIFVHMNYFEMSWIM